LIQNQSDPLATVPIDTQRDTRLPTAEIFRPTTVAAVVAEMAPSLAARQFLVSIS
jgi:hypothetical protein